MWLNDGSCIRLQPEHQNHVWSWDFVFDRTNDGRRIKLMVVIDVFADLMQTQGVPEHIRSDNGYCESFNGKLRDGLLNGELFNTLREAQVIIERWRVFYNTLRPHSSLGYRPPAPETLQPIEEPQLAPIAA